MKVLIAYEYKYRFYSEVLAKGITKHRPHLHVRPTGLKHFESELEVFDPHAVVSSQPLSNIDPTNNRAAWVELPAEPSSPADICLDGNHAKAYNPTLGELVSVLDEAEALVLREDRPLDGC